jgi:membrane associated rhomboid family serine protease
MGTGLQKRGSDQSLQAIQGVILLAAIVGVMWLVEIINAIDSYRLDADGIRPRDLGRVWGIGTAPFLHASLAHLISNTIPFVFMGVIIALHGAKRLAQVTVIVVVIGGLGTWLIAPAGSTTVGASGVVFGYATYLLTRGLFDHSVAEILIGGLVGVVWGGALLASLVPHDGVSWQAHLCGGIAGVIAAALLSRRPDASGPGPRGSRDRSPASALDRALAK